MGAGVLTQVLMPTEQAFTHSLSHLFSPWLAFDTPVSISCSVFRLVSAGLESDLTPRAMSFVHAAAAAAATEVDTGQAVPVSTLTY